MEQNSKLFFEGAANTLWKTFQCTVFKKSVWREFVRSTARRLGLSTRVTAIQQSQANGRAEQRVRALRERSQIMVEGRKTSQIGTILDHPVAQRSTETCRMEPELPCKE